MSKNPTEEVDIFGVVDLGNGIMGFLGTLFWTNGEGVVFTEKKVYFSRTFYFRDTMGLPLSMIFDHLKKFADMTHLPCSPCLLQFRSNALAAGWSERKVAADIREALGEVFGTAAAENFMEDIGKVVIMPTEIANV